MAYSGSQVAISNSHRVSPQHLTTSPSFPNHASNGSLVAHYARESSKQLAAGIVTLGDMGYKKLSRYYSELIPEGNNCQSGTARVQVNGVANGHLPEADNVGMVCCKLHKSISNLLLVEQSDSNLAWSCCLGILDSAYCSSLKEIYSV